MASKFYKLSTMNKDNNNFLGINKEKNKILHFVTFTCYAVQLSIRIKKWRILFSPKKTLVGQSYFVQLILPCNACHKGEHWQWKTYLYDHTNVCAMHCIQSLFSWNGNLNIINATILFDQKIFYFKVFKIFLSQV